MTEDQAKTKWCPMARMPQTMEQPSPSTNYAIQCIGTACMMWRALPKVDAGAEQVIEKGADGLNRFATKTVWAEAGYCGLAGKP